MPNEWAQRRAKRTGESLVGDSARGLLGRLDRGGNLDRAIAVTAWREAAGEEVASHARGFAMRGGELLVIVDSSVWAGELSALSEDYRTAVNRIVGRELVRSMRFSVSKRVSEENAWDSDQTRREDARRVDRIEPVPATKQEAAQVRAMAAPIHDVELREAAVGAALRALEWRKGRKARKSPQAAAGRLEDTDSQPDH